MNEAALKSGIYDAGLQASYSDLPPPPVLTTQPRISVFPSNAKRIIWYGRLDIKGRGYSFLSDNLTARWLDPEGRLYYEEKFDTARGRQGWIQTSMMIPSDLSRIPAGTWRMKILRGDTVLDEEEFLIIDVGKKIS